MASMNYFLIRQYYGQIKKGQKVKQWSTKRNKENRPEIEQRKSGVTWYAPEGLGSSCSSYGTYKTWS